MMNRKLKRGELALFLLPIAFLVGVGVFLRVRDKPPAQSKLSVSEMALRDVSKPSDKFKKVEVKLSVAYSGSEPQWWPEVKSLWLQNLRFVRTTGKEYTVDTYAGGGANGQSFALNYTCVVPEEYDTTQPGQFTGTVICADGAAPPKTLGFTRFSMPVQFP